MKCKVSLFICLSFLGIVGLSAYNFQKELDLNYIDTQLVIQEAKNALIDDFDDRLYLDQNRVAVDVDGSYILMDNGGYIFSTNVKVDEYGIYLPKPAMTKPGQKLFICICNDCGHRWYSGAFTWRCPREDCRSTNFQTVPDGW